MMPRRSANGGCLCRVPITDAAVPMCTTEAELAAWASANEVEILPDHMGRPSIDLPTAYRLFEQQQASVAAHRAAQDAERAREREAITKAQATRQKTHETEYAKGIRKGLSAAEASHRAWEAVHDVEKNLPGGVKDRLGGVRINTAVLHDSRFVGSSEGAGWS